MDPITASIVGALLAGVLSGFTDVGKVATRDAYIKLKGLLSKKFGARNGVMSAITQLELKPDSTNRQGVLKEEITAANAGQDAEVLSAARNLLTLVQQQQHQQISLRGSPVQGSIYQVGHNQYQVGRDQYNVHATDLVGTGTRRGIRRIISVWLLIHGSLNIISGIALIPVIYAFINFSHQIFSGSPENAQEIASFIAYFNSFGTAFYIIIYATIALGILMVIGGIWMSRSLRKP